MAHDNYIKSSNIETVGPLAIRYTWIRPEISMTASTMLMMVDDEQTTDHNKLTLPGSLAGGTRWHAQQAWGNWLEIDPQQMQERWSAGCFTNIVHREIKNNQ
ncbi:hypothetical protein ACF0H5_014955 [Mactra antiquata]